jgi:hypothetical protein
MIAIADLIEALVDRERLRSAPLLKDQAERRALALERAFGVAGLLELEGKSKNQRKLTHTLGSFIRMLSDLRSPFDEIMEGTIPLEELLNRRDSIEQHEERLRAECREACILLIRALVPGVRDAVSPDEAVAAGLDDLASISSSD